MITVTLTKVGPECTPAIALINGQERMFHGNSKYVSLGSLVQAFPDVFSLGAKQRTMPLEDLGKLVFAIPRSFDITIREISQ